MAAKLGVPPSTIKSWHKKRSIPDWRRQSVMETAVRHNVDLSFDEVINIRPDLADEQARAA